MTKDVPVLDDANLRENNNKKIVEGINELGLYAKDMRKGARISMYLSIIITILIFCSLFAAFITGGINGIIDLRSSKRSFSCTSNDFNDTLRTYVDAQSFITLYGGYCKLIIKGEYTSNLTSRVEE